MSAGSKPGVTQVDLVEKLVVSDNAFRDYLDRQVLLDGRFLVTFINRCENFSEPATPDSSMRTVTAGNQMPVRLKR
jgi:hypothetical protein